MNSREIPWVIEEQTEVKHQLLRRYVDVWMPIMFSQQVLLGHRKQRLVYVDGFSGPGEYWSDDSKSIKVPGSPLIVAEIANKYIDENNSREVIILCTDSDPRCIGYLEPLLKAVNKHNQGWHAMHCTFENGMAEILDHLDKVKRNIAPAFVFVDPFGYSGFSMDMMRRLMTHKRTELFINLMYYDINRFLVEQHATPHLDALYGTDKYQEARSIQNDEKISFLVQLYCHQLTESTNAKFAIPFRVNTPGQGTRPRYFLIHVSQHIKALKVMKDNMAKTSDQPYRFEAIGIGANQQFDLFEPSGEEQLCNSIYDFVCCRSKRCANYNEIEEWAYVFTFGINKDIKKALVKLKNDKKVIIERPPRARKNTVAEGAIIKCN